MKPRFDLGRCLAFVLPALLFWHASSLQASAAPRPQDAQQPDASRSVAGARTGQTFRGAPGVTETVDEIMARSLDAEPLEREEPQPRLPQTPVANFLAIGMAETAGNLIPPNTAGDVGPAQVLVATTGRIKVF